MKPRSVIRVLAVLAVVAVLAALLVAPSVAKPAASRASGRYLVVARSAADLSGLRAKAVREGAKVIRTMPQLKAMAIQGTDSVRRSLAADGRTRGVARDRLFFSPHAVDNARFMRAAGLEICGRASRARAAS